MQIRGVQLTLAIHGFRLAACSHRGGHGNRLARCLHCGVMESVAAKFTFRQRHAVHTEVGQFFLHYRVTRQHTRHLGLISLCIGQCFQQIEHAAAFGKYGFVCRMMRANRLVHCRVGLQLLQMQFRIATGQIQAVCFWQKRIGQRRKNSSSAPKVRSASRLA